MNAKTNQPDKATPRPWHVAINAVVADTVHSAKGQVAKMQEGCMDNIDANEREENALLIVKAVNEHAALEAVAEAAKLEHLALCKLIEYIETPSDKRGDVRDALYPARECRFNASEALTNLAALRGQKVEGSIQKKQISRAVIEAAPTCSYEDAQPDRYRVWMADNTVIKASTKSELRMKLTQAVREGKAVKT